MWRLRLIAIVVLGLGDYLIRFQDRGLRVLCWLGLLGGVGWTCYRSLLLPLAAPLGDIELARRLERHFPALGDRLLSAVEFLRQTDDDPIAGSPALRRTVIAQTAAEVERVDFAETLDDAPPRRAAGIAAGVLLAAGLLGLLAPAASHIALARLLNPFSDVAWPQATHLAARHLVNRVAKGQAFEVEVVDAHGARLPADVCIHYRFSGPDHAIAEETEPMQWLGDARVARRENVTQPFSYWMEGGDDHSMQPIAVAVVEPPAVESLRVRLFPPAYTGWPVETVEGNIRALVGTRLEMDGVANKPLKSATLCFESGPNIVARVSEDGLNFAVGGADGTPRRQVECLLVQADRSRGAEPMAVQGVGKFAPSPIHRLPSPSSGPAPTSM